MRFRALTVLGLVFVLEFTSLVGGLVAQQPGSGAPPAPTKLDGRRHSISLDGTIADVVPAGDFRYLALVLAEEKKLVVVDTKSREVAKELPLPSRDVQVAGTLDHLLIVDNEHRKVEFWLLDGFQRGKTLKSPYNKIHAIACGSRTLGPVLVYFTDGAGKKAKDGVAFLNLIDLKLKPLVAPNIQPIKAQAKVHFFAARNGRGYGMWGTGEGTVSPSYFVDGGPVILMRSGFDQAGYIAPNSTCEMIGTASMGAKDGGFTAPKGGAVHEPNTPILPSTHPSIYMKIDQSGGGSARDGLTLTFYELQREYPRSQVKGLDLGGYLTEQAKTDPLSLAKRIHYLMHDKMLISIPFSNKEIVFQDYDFTPTMKQMFEAEPQATKWKREFTLITSIPPAKFERGKTFTYQVTVDSSRTPFFSPKPRGVMGASISKEGLLTWDVPKDFADDTAEIAFEVRTEGTGQDFQGFKLFLAK